MTDSSLDTRGARMLLVAATLVIVVAGLRAAATLVLPVLVSLFLAVATLPLMSSLRRWGAPAPLAVAVTVLASIAVLGTFVVLVTQSLNEFTFAAMRYQHRLQSLVEPTVAWLRTHGVDAPEALARDVLNPAAVMDLVGATLKALTNLLSNVFIVLLVLVFALFEAVGFGAKVRLAFPHASGADWLERARRDIQRYLAIKSLISAGVGLAAGTWVAILGVEFPLLWGLMAFVLNYIPNLGSFLAAVPPSLLALAGGGPWAAAMVASGYLVINVALSNFLEPVLMGRRLGLSPLVVLISLLFWGWVWGPVGMLLAVPVTTVVRILCENTTDLRWVAVMLDAAPRPAAVIARPPARPSPAPVAVEAPQRRGSD
ncbi:MAG: AI-2E family transporter [Acidobacteria bacterium]|nr:AI-2E family transporter [Acidobacteriota bacterium]